jgi:murein L,D-transpeptidase YafK
MFKLTLFTVALISMVAQTCTNNIQPSNIEKVDTIKVYKAKRLLETYYKGKLIKSYKISLGGSPVGHKQEEGDNKTPEGAYVINDKNPNSAYHKNLGISYPNAQDIKAAKKRGKSPGGDIKIHGLPNGMGSIGKAHLLSDWTLGCLALTNEEIDELYDAVPIGTPILIYP